MRILWHGPLPVHPLDADGYGGSGDLARATFEVVNLAADATVGDLARRLGVGAVDGLLLDRRWFPAELALTETAWCDGVEVGVREVGVRDGVEVGVRDGVGGLASKPLPPAALDPLCHATPAGLVAFNRPPRSVPTAGPATLAAPTPPERPSPVSLAVAAVVVPLMMAAMFVLISGNWLFALLSGVGPIVAVSSWVSARRRTGRLGRIAGATYRADVARFRTALAAEVDAEAVRRRVRWPDLDTLLDRVEQAPLRLWERRSRDADAWSASVGTGDLPWCPPLEFAGRWSAMSSASSRPDVPSAVDLAVVELGVLREVPMGVDLAPGAVLGLVGPPERTRPVAAAIVVQLVVHHGPADLALGVVGCGDARRAWRWAGWLPHSRSAEGVRRLAWDDEVDDFARSLLDMPDRAAGVTPASGAGTAVSVSPPSILLVVDGAEVLRGRSSPVRDLLRGAAGPLRAIVVAERRDDLPATCTTVIEVGATTCVVQDLRSAMNTSCRPTTIGVARAAALARGMARYDDPEQPGTATRLPTEIRLVDLVPLSPDASVAIASPEVIADDARVADLRARWAAHAAGGGVDLTVPLGVGDEGPMPVDLVADGPHALVAGTTGAGKSELLRTWVVAMAICASPADLNLLLVDYKGGSAFDACARLPHVVGVVTDLDQTLAARALRCLDAELRFRERAFRSLGAGDLSGYRRLHAAAGESVPDGAPSLARLVVVVDEFATLAAELPAFLDALVGVAQRGRSLGVHLVLATQRPQGAVNDNIRANTNLRIALRVTDRADSVDVIGSDVAARLARTVPGRAFVRLGPGQVVAMQTATTTLAVAIRAQSTVDLAPPPAGWGQGSAALLAFGQQDDGSSPTDLDLLVAAVRAAATATGTPPARIPWPDPLPVSIDADELTATDADELTATNADEVVPLWLADDPDAQTRRVGGWEPTVGNLLVYGAVGSGTTTVLVTAVLQVAAALPTARCHVYIVDGGGGLGSLADVPHVGGVVPVGDVERLTRLVRHLTDELRDRRALAPAQRAALPLVVLAVDGTRAMFAELDADPLLGLAEQLTAILVEGPALGICAVLTAEAASAIRHAIASSARQRLVLHLAEPAEARQLGARELPGTTAGRGVDVYSGLHVQVARTGDVQRAVADLRRGHPGAGGPAPIDTLPLTVTDADLPPAACDDDGGCRVPLGIGALDLRPVYLDVRPGEHVLVAGPRRSGRSGVLERIARSLERLPDVQVVRVAGPRSPLTQDPDNDGRAPVLLTPSRLDRIPAIVDDRSRASATCVVLVDDADGIEDRDGVLATLLARTDVVIVAAGRADAFRSAYGHWTRGVRTSRTGVLLAPDLDLDGDLLGVRLPRRLPVRPAPGRGFIVTAGDPVYAQFGQAR